MAKILVLHGVNLNMLGIRQPAIYGTTTLAEVNQALTQLAGKLGHDVTTYQSNAEHELIQQIQVAPQEGHQFVIINPGAFTHTSIALRDALAGQTCPFIEVHLSNIFARETFRHHSFLSDIAIGVITGLGSYGYTAALYYADNHLRNQP